MAKQHRDKLSHVSPVWYQLRLQDGAPYLAGTHNVDAGWMGDLRKTAADVSPKSHIIQSLTLEGQCVHHRCMMAA